MKNDRKQQRQEAILNAALKLFTNKGYFNTSMNDIQVAADMSVGSLYNYFQSKESIAITLFSNIENCLHEALCEIERRHQNSHDRCKTIVQHLYETTERDSDIMQFMLYTKHREFMAVEKSFFLSLPFQKMKDIVINGQANGEIRQIEHDVAVNAIFGSAIQMILLRLDGILDKSLVAYFDESWECCWSSVKTDLSTPGEQRHDST